MVNTIGQTFAWKGLHPMAEAHVATCDSCQCNKQSNKKAYRKIPLTPAICTPLGKGSGGLLRAVEDYVLQRCNRQNLFI